MATWTSPKHFRTWSSTDSLDPNDIQRLYHTDAPGTVRKKRCVSTWTFSLVVLMISVFFLVGMLVGFYIRESQNAQDGTSTLTNTFDINQRSDGLTDEQVRMIHEQITYYMSGESIRKITRDLGESPDQSTNSKWDQDTTRYIKKELDSYPFDKVDLQEYYTAVTYPDPSSPNRLQVIDSSNTTVLNVTLTNERAKGDDQATIRPPYVARSVSGTVEGKLLYGNYGSDLDLLHLKNVSISTQGSVFLLRSGRVPVYTQVTNAEKAGAVGVLLYEDPADVGVVLPQTYIPYASIQPDYKGNVPRIPVQTISQNTAAYLLAMYQDGLPAPVSWRGGLNITYRLGVSRSDKWRIRLLVNNTETYEKVTNVIASINGDMESDRVIMFGVSRTTFPGSTTDPRLGSAILLEVARAFTVVRNVDKWSPRRSVQFCSWGGSELSHAGLLAYLQQNKHLFPRKTVVYIDLDLHINRTRSNFTSLGINSNAALAEVVKAALYEVPDPDDNSLTVADALYHHSTTGVQHVGKPSLVWDRGVPVITASYGLVNSRDASGVMNDVNHHYRYHLAAARVMSLLSLRMIDDADLPFNIADATSSFHQSLLNFKDTLEKDAFSNVLAKAEKLKDAGDMFQHYIKMHGFNKIPMDRRRMNDIKMYFNKLFTIPEEMRNHQVSSMVDTDASGDLLFFSRLADLATVTGDWSDFYAAKDELLLAISEAISLLAIS